MDLSTADAPPEIRRKCRSALQGGQDELSCLQFLTRMATEQSRNCYQVFVASGNEPNILHLLVDRLGTASADMRTHILSCLNAFDMPEYLLPAFLTSLESSSWQVRMQAILALQSLHNFTPQQKQILQDALTGILDRDSSDLVKQASKQTLVLWEEFASYYNGGGSDNNNGGNGAGATASSTNNSGYHDVNIMMGGGGQAQVGVSNGTGGLLNAGDHGVGDLTSNSMGGAVPHGQIMKMDTSSTDHLSPPGWAIGGDPLQISRSSTHVDSSFDGSSDSLRSSLIGGGGSQHQNQLTVGGSSSSTAPLAGLSNSSTNSPYFRVPADFVSRITRNDSNMQLLEDVHGVILGASPVGYDPMTEECVSLLNVNVLKKFMESVLSQTHFKVTLTTLYIIGDLVAPVASNNVDQATALQESALKVLPSILHRIFDKLGDTKFVIRQTTCKLVTKIIGAMDLDMNSDLLQLVYLLFEEFENSSGGKSEALVTVLTTVLIVSPRAGSQDMANLISTRLQKWFEKTKDERVAILLGEGLAVTSRKLGIVGPQEAYSHASEKYTSILRSQVSRSRDAMLPAVNEEGLLEYAPEIQTALEGTGSSLLGGFYSSDNIFGSNAYNMSKVRKMPAPILKTDDRMSCVSGSTNSSRKPRVTFSDVGDEKHSSSRSSASASTSGSLSCGVSSAASSASNSTSGVETGGVHGSGVGDLTKTFLSLKGEHGGSKLAAAASLHLSSSPSKNFGAPDYGQHLVSIILGILVPCSTLVFS
ncbi:unnamed protein product [Amoebophrya sp. A25]|nr:unnamed protein product [Amoebophrya sp. A25]|eukprot:GSA25T00014913001.1